jgi:methyl-accepting chemotaxis protein
MPPLVQACVVIVTMSLVTLAFVAVRALVRIEKTAAELTETTRKAVDTVQQTASQVQQVARRVDGVVASVGESVPGIRRVVTRFEQVGDRAAQLSNVVLDQVESPVRNAVAVVNGIRTGTSRFLNALARRVPHHHSHTNGGLS